MHLNMSYSDIRSLPIRYRRWFIDRLSRHFDQQRSMRKSGDTRSKSSPEKKIDMENVEKFFAKFDK